MTTALRQNAHSGCNKFHKVFKHYKCPFGVRTQSKFMLRRKDKYGGQNIPLTHLQKLRMRKFIHFPSLKWKVHLSPRRYLRSECFTWKWRRVPTVEPKCNFVKLRWMMVLWII